MYGVQVSCSTAAEVCFAEAIDCVDECAKQLSGASTRRLAPE